MKVTIVGAGAVGTTTADNLVRKNLAEQIILLDRKEGIAEGKAQDIAQTASFLGIDPKIKGVTNDYEATAGSKVAVITSGIPRKPGMTREELISTNADIVKNVVANLVKYSPDIILIIVTNPLDTMTYLAAKTSGLPKNRIIGMGGALDSARFKYQLAHKLDCSQNDISAMVIGGHGDTTMIPLMEHSTWNSIKISSLLSDGDKKNIIENTMIGGATLTSLIGTSAWYAPGAAAASVVESILKDQHKLVPSSVLLEGEYGLNDIAIGVPVVINKEGWKEIVQINLSEEEHEALKKSAEVIREMNKVLVDMNVI